MSSISVIGAGAWGTALAQVFANNNHDVTLWAREDALAQYISTHHENNIYLAGTPLHPHLKCTSDLSLASRAQDILMAVPAQFMNDVLARMAPQLTSSQSIIICAKGITKDSLELLSDSARHHCPTNPIAVLTGPNFAADIARGLPSASTLACDDAAQAKRIQHHLTSKNLRLYTTNDMIGAQVGGAVKNVIAIACGILHGLKMGESARAALVTRGLAEMARLSVRMGGQRETLMGQCGIGDLMLTCSSTQSRNFSFGARLATGEEHAPSRSVVEGVHTAYAAYHLTEKLNIEMPIVNAVHGCIYQHKSVKDAVHNLLDRPAREEKE
jgi:glycerol-3-phosphate dehydrogenase (NAD(P)+)